MKEFSNVAKRKINTYRLDTQYVSDEIVRAGVLRINFTTKCCDVDEFGRVTWIK